MSRVQTKEKKPQWNWDVAAQPIEAKVQQSSMQREVLRSIAREGNKQREVRRTFKILREIWLNIRVEKVNRHKSIIVKVLLDSGTMVGGQKHIQA